jgi:hypothetical protein
MPSKQRVVERVVDWPRLTDRFYEIQISGLARLKKPNRIEICFRHLSDDQCGREFAMSFQLPIHPAGPLPDLLKAAGHSVEIGSEIDLSALAGKKLTVQFESGAETITSFQPIKETHDVPDA